MTKIPVVPPEGMIPREETMKRIEKKIRREEIKNLEEAIEGWRFTDVAIEQMKKLNNKTKTIGIEHGSLLCGDNKTKKIDLYNECTGTECSIDIEHKKCPNNKTDLGTFHTHYSDSKVSRFSPQDMLDEDKFRCLGTPNAAKENEKLVCLVHTKESLKHERSARRTDELVVLHLKYTVEDKYGYLRDLDEIIEDDYYRFNPEKYKNLNKR